LHSSTANLRRHSSAHDSTRWPYFFDWTVMMCRLPHCQMSNLLASLQTCRDLKKPVVLADGRLADVDSGGPVAGRFTTDEGRLAAVLRGRSTAQGRLAAVPCGRPRGRLTAEDRMADVLVSPSSELLARGSVSAALITGQKLSASCLPAMAADWGPVTDGQVAMVATPESIASVTQQHHTMADKQN
jgi:hypothetical protein